MEGQCLKRGRKEHKRVKKLFLVRVFSEDVAFEAEFVRRAHFHWVQVWLKSISPGEASQGYQNSGCFAPLWTPDHMVLEADATLFLCFFSPWLPEGSVIVLSSQPPGI